MSRIALIVSDVDGTLVTSDKRLTLATIRSVEKLYDKGIGFTIISSRPPYGLRMLVEPLRLKLPLGAFNGSSIVDPELNVIQRNIIPEVAARTSMQLLRKFGVDIWLFTNEHWLIVRDDGNFVLLEQKTIQMDPVIVPDFADFADRACKIVGVSADPEKLAFCEISIQNALGAKASAARSQSYYLDITPAGLDKGTFLKELARRLHIPSNHIATFGDMHNDLAMFEQSGVSYAMGNAPDKIKARATHITGSNENDGVAKAIDEILVDLCKL